MTPELVRLILARAKLFAAAKAHDDSLLEFYFWDRHAWYFALNGELTDAQRDRLLEDEPLILDRSPFDADVSENTECDQMIIRDGRVSWLTIPKHSDTYAQTPAVSIEAIGHLVDPPSRRSAARRAPRASRRTAA